jgi:hypothetical protein
MAMARDGTIRVKPQNHVAGLPLRVAEAAH